jgi:putative MFS transporter
MPKTSNSVFRFFNATVLVSALGYFVDMFDISLFAAVRTPSLISLGIVDPDQLLNLGVRLYNCQMIGMLLGGLVWGILGDKKGRVTVLYGSILLYSLGNIGNAFVQSVFQYEVFRFIAGFGLAGELGAAVTLVSEVMKKEDRGYGTTIVATLGMLGSVAAALSGKFLDWRHAYLLGGGLGLLLLFSRMKMFDSDIFKDMKEKKIPLGDLRLLLRPARLGRYLSTIAIGIPIYFITGIILTFAPELTSELSLTGPVTAADALLYGSFGLAAGDLLSGLLSQQMKSRKKTVLLFLLMAMSLIYVYTKSEGVAPVAIYFLSFGLGTCAGYWAVLVTIAAEQFGTNMRSTVATSVPNFVRASGMISVSSFVILKEHFTKIESAMILGGVIFAVALFALSFLQETYGKDLDFVETD